MIDRPAPRSVRRSLLPVVAGALLFALAACSGAAGPGTTPTPPADESPISQQEAVERVLASDPQFAGIGPLNRDLIGQSAWYEVTPGTVGWRVIVTKGWGDCQAGCIERHTWIFEVDPAGTVRLVEEIGDPVPGSLNGGAIPAEPPVAIPAEGGPWLVGRALAGPVCPVVSDPPDPACVDRPIAGATVIVRDAAGAEVARATTDADGAYLVAVPGGGTFTVEGEPVEGVLGTPAPVLVAVGAAPADWAVADLPYDTGIR
jgi:hypothetical protein